MSSFVRIKRKKKKGQTAATSVRSVPPSKLPKGTRPWINQQALTSSGLGDLDDVLGGGLACGTLLLIKEDKHTQYFNVLQKYFVAEGLAHEHQICCASTNSMFVEEFIHKLPANRTLQKGEEEDKIDGSENFEELQKERMKQTLEVAWQYEKYRDQELDAASNLSSNKRKSKTRGKHRRSADICHSHDFSRNIDASFWNSRKSSFTHVNNFGSEDIYAKTLFAIKAFLRQGSSSARSNSPTVSRISLHSVASPLWSDHGDSDPDQNRKLLWFLYSLRCLVRDHASHRLVCLSVPSYLLPESLTRKIEHLCDYVLQIESFTGDMESTAESEYGDYDGLIHVVKLARVNTLAAPQIAQKRYLFKMKRNRMVVDRLCLPPESSRSTKSETSNVQCLPGGSLDKKLEF